MTPKTTNLKFGLEVKSKIYKFLDVLPRKQIAKKAINNNSAIIVCKNFKEVISVVNDIAPEHLEISCTEPQLWEPLLTEAGAIFMGAYTSESLGDYCAGPNHVLPTSSTAKFSSPLGVYDFQKRSSLIQVSRQGAQNLGPIAAELAYAEGLQGHALAAEYRLDKNAK